MLRNPGSFTRKTGSGVLNQEINQDQAVFLAIFLEDLTDFPSTAVLVQNLSVEIVRIKRKIGR